jgi:hypothetical protein
MFYSEDGLDQEPAAGVMGEACNPACFGCVKPCLRSNFLILSLSNAFAGASHFLSAGSAIDFFVSSLVGCLETNPKRTKTLMPFHVLESITEAC